MSKKFKKSDSDVYSISHLLNDNREGLFNLDRDYQRGFVWSKEKKESYIYNLIKIGLNPIPIIFNKDSKSILYCIDGKQRLSAIINFSKNEVCAIDKEKEELIFYDKIVRNYKILVSSKDYENYKPRILSDVEMRELKNEKLFVLVYDNLEYQQEIEVFKRVNSGIPVGINEKLMCFIRKENSAKEFTKLREKYRDVFNHLKIGQSGKDTDFMYKLIYFNETKKKTGTPQSIGKYMDDLSNDFTEFKKILEKYTKLLDLYFSDLMFLSPKITFKNSKIITNFLVMLLVYMDNDPIFSKKLKKTHFNNSFIKFIISCDDDVYEQSNLPKENEEYISNSVDKKNLEKINKIMKDNYKIFYKNITIDLQKKKQLDQTK